MKNIIRYLGDLPKIDPTAYISESANIIGKVTIGKDAGIWFNSVLRGDVNSIFIGDGTNIQDLTMVHVCEDTPVHIGNFVTVGHSCIIHGCTIEDHVLVGMGTTILDGALIKKNCIIGANSLITKDKVFEEGSLILGSPAKVIRALTPEEIRSIEDSASHYIHGAKIYLKEQTEVTP